MGGNKENTGNIRLIAILGTAILLAAACGSGSDEVSAENSRGLLPEEVTTTQTGDEDSDTTEESDTSDAAQTSLQEVDTEGAELVLQELFSLTEPTALATRTGDDSIWFTERAGTVVQVERSIINSGEGRSSSQTEFLKPVTRKALDISSQVSTEFEDGLLGIEFSSDGNTLFLSYNTPDQRSVVSAFDMVGNVADPNSETIILDLDQPFRNHNGGQIVIGPDGFLYIGLGDGGGSDDPSGHGQNTQTLLGSILRVDPETPDVIPASNPFVADESLGQPEIWLYGVRNPWRFSFDPANGDLWIGDVGQNTQEEITFIPSNGNPAGRGANLGWADVEGTNVRADSAPAGHVSPIFTYNNTANSCSVVGGHVYRGDLLEWRVDVGDGQLEDRSLVGSYVFGDFCNSQLSILSRDGDSVASEQLDLGISLSNLISIGQVDGELFTLEQGGRVSALTTSSPSRDIVVLEPNQPLPRASVSSEIEVLPGGQTDPAESATTIG